MSIVRSSLGYEARVGIALASLQYEKIEAVTMYRYDSACYRG
jgi:hypothetical protein